MSERDQLLSILRRMRRRLRAMGALQGAVAGGVAGLLVGAGALVVQRASASATPARVPLLLAGALVLLGAAAFAARRVAWSRCARLLDAALDGQDRVLSAWTFANTAGAGPFAGAAIADALGRAGRVSPAGAAPLRWPRGLGALAVAAGVMLAVALLPPMRRGPRDKVAVAAPRAAPAARLARLEGDALDAQRDFAQVAAQAARALSDQTMAQLAAALADTVDQLGGAGMERGAALDRLAELQRRAEAEARDAEALGRGLQRAGAALAETSATRPLGQALVGSDGAATSAAAAALAARMAGAAAGARNAVARALERAAERSAGAGGEGPSAPAGATSASNDDSASDGEPGQRRLQRESAGARDDQIDDRGGQRRPPERQLQRLTRALEDAARGCRDNPAACQGKLGGAERALSDVQQQARGAQARRRLSSAIQQLREELQRQGAGGQPGERERQRQRERQFARAARGQPGSRDGRAAARARGGERGNGDNPGDPDGDRDSDDDQATGPGDDSMASASQGSESAGETAGEPTGETQVADPSGAAAEGGERGQSSAGRGASSAGDGIGNQAGGDALGRGKDLRAARGRDKQARVASNGGPKRSQVIQAAAARGFARGDYRGVFGDYDAVVEESLHQSDVPPGQRYLVRRYFQLIRPRPAPPARATTTGAP